MTWNLKVFFYFQKLKDVLKIWRFYEPGSGSGLNQLCGSGSGSGYNQSGSTSLAECAGNNNLR